MKKGYYYVLITMLIWGISPIIFKSLSTSTTVNIQIFVRTVVGFIVLYTYIKLTKKDKIEILNYNKKDMTILFIVVLMFYLYEQFWLNGIKLSQANLSSFVISNIAPILTMTFIGIFIKEERKHLKSKYRVISIFLAFISSMLVVVNFSELSVDALDLGLILVIIAALFWGLYTLGIKKFFQESDPLEFCMNTNLLVALYFLITIICVDEFKLLLQINFKTIFALIIVGLIADAFSNITFFKSITMLSAVKANIIFIFTPIVTLLVSALVLKEGMNMQQIIGSGLALIASGFIIYSETLKRKADI